MYDLQVLFGNLEFLFQKVSPSNLHRAGVDSRMNESQEQTKGSAGVEKPRVEEPQMLLFMLVLVCEQELSVSHSVKPFL